VCEYNFPSAENGNFSAMQHTIIGKCFLKIIIEKGREEREKVKNNHESP
jgi:hypothetical protein